jgi:hypothetical protein
MIVQSNSMQLPGEVSTMELKPPFTGYSLKLLIGKINAAPELLEGDWRELVRSEFLLSAKQEHSLIEVTPERVEEIQQFFEQAAQYIRQGGAIQGRIVKRPIEEQTPEAVHEVHIELIEIPTTAPLPETLPIPQALRIAHCDADCTNWGWNSF